MSSVNILSSVYLLTMRNFQLKHVCVVLSLCVVSSVYFKSYTSIATINRVDHSYQSNLPLNVSTIPNSILPNFLDGCYHLYLDVGSNIGTQVRKLFEPEKYPLAKVNSIFNKNFGSIDERRKAYLEGGRVVCAVGFEPNYRLSQYLEEIERKYTNCGWRVTFLTKSAVSDHDGIERFYTDGGYKQFELSGGILPPKVFNTHIKKLDDNSTTTNVTLIRLSEFLRNVVGKRMLPVHPSKKHPPRVLMKMDIEGSEVDVIPDLIFTGGLQYINSFMVEWHGRFENLSERKKAHRILDEIIKLISEYSFAMKGHGAKFDFTSINLDDETYSGYNMSFPKC